MHILELAYRNPELTILFLLIIAGIVDTWIETWRKRQ
jgi:hypothetical protein